ncbi:glycoside hydrolase family 18 protein [Sphaerobolus stellatus SS14]|uniref:Unplaced genomic scaffold SPHSTscaffold_95, whole genome shotgun sequence n=1 Tax=Sphaerobolus stellatus (strain SS14) TaxID=990650 RepID=A0A0C9V6X3_SPHS4|nr:glycoside hydrolase family 18 protein [Sphaerobolus stellatus SS14]
MRFIAFLSFVATVSAGPIPDATLSKAGPHSSKFSSQSQASPVASTRSTRTPLPAPSGNIASAWWTDYHAASTWGISWEKYNHLMYSFAVPQADGSLTMPSSTDDMIKNFTDTAHAKNIPVSLTVGGWGGGAAFSALVASANMRTTFITALSNLVAQHEFDGIDFDWEYPTTADDVANFLLLLQEMRANPSTSNLILSAATPVTGPWINTADVSGFAKVFDFIEIMNYDVWGPWSNAIGPNAPLDDSCASSHQEGSATSAVQKWTAAGMPANKIVLGVASYGHAYMFQGSDFAAFAPFTPNGPLAPTDSWNPPPSSSMEFWGLIQLGYLSEDGTAKSGINYIFDSCSKTAYVHDPSKQVVVSYDDVPVFQAKGEFIASKGLRGFAMWEAGSDYKDMLLDAILNPSSSGSSSGGSSTASMNMGMSSTNSMNTGTPSTSSMVMGSSATGSMSMMQTTSTGAMDMPGATPTGSIGMTTTGSMDMGTTATPTMDMGSTTIPIRMTERW